MSQAVRMSQAARNSGGIMSQAATSNPLTDEVQHFYTGFNKDEMRKFVDESYANQKLRKMSDDTFKRFFFKRLQKNGDGNVTYAAMVEELGPTLYHSKAEFNDLLSQYMAAKGMPKTEAEIDDIIAQFPCKLQGNGKYTLKDLSAVIVPVMFNN